MFLLEIYIYISKASLDSVRQMKSIELDSSQGKPKGMKQ